ncbi:CAP domain-containing protein [Deinococcus sp.]|uniref:CAP domain-containing protein n=1 Tax=Deinococcus sp. TaxID=47478 RepID=UPI003B5C8D8D
MSQRLYHHLRHATLLLGAALILSACGGSTTSPPSPQTTSPVDLPSGEVAETALDIARQTPSLNLAAGQRTQLKLLQNGAALSSNDLMWASSDASVLIITTKGLVSALKTGQASLRVSSAPTAPQTFSFEVAVKVTTPTAGATDDFKNQVLQLINTARAQGGSCANEAFAPASALRWNSKLATAAQSHAADMAAKDYFDHTSQDGRTFDARITQAGYTWSSVAENIAAGQPTPQEVVKAWIDSPGHCRNVFNAKLTELGVGYAEGGSYRQYWVQDFGTPKPETL